jgi:hypothetical protein
MEGTAARFNAHCEKSHILAIYFVLSAPYYIILLFFLCFLQNLHLTLSHLIGYE